jgi:hypothetical protein
MNNKTNNAVNRANISKSKPAKVAPVVRTPEEQAVYLADQQRRIDEARERERKLVVFENEVSKMSQRQLQGTLRRFSRDKNSPLTAGLASILSTVLANTKTAENPFAKLSAYPL